MNQQSISILGCGWLGFPLAQRLVAEGFSLKGATTTKAKIPLLQSKGIEPFLINCTPHPQGEDVAGFFKSDILFLNIPFRRTLPDPVYYQKQIQSVTNLARQNGVKKIIFTSSTSVYPSDIGDAFEDVKFTPANARSKVLLDIEHELLADTKIKTVVLRLAGLYGGARKIGMFLSAKKSIEGANSPVNLIHLDDCVLISTQIIQQGISEGVFNLCCDEHPLKKDLYTQAAKRQKIELPEFSCDNTPQIKIVRNDKIKKALNYQFIHPAPII